MVIDYQRVKLFGKRFFFLKNSLDQNCAILIKELKEKNIYYKNHKKNIKILWVVHLNNYYYYFNFLTNALAFS